MHLLVALLTNAPRAKRMINPEISGQVRAFDCLLYALPAKPDLLKIAA